MKIIEKLTIKPESKVELAIEVKGLTKSFGYHRVLSDLTFKLPKGEHLVILGRNGCGKTTLINILATLLQPTAGLVTINGLDIKKRPLDIRHKLGIIGHATMLYSGLTITENLQFYGRMYGITASDTRIGDLIAFLELEKWRHRRVSELSRGIQQRVAIARALIHGPSILLLDEPESGLDPAALSLLENILHELRAKGATVVATSHNLGFTLRTGSRIAILDKGRFAFESVSKGMSLISLEEIFARYSGLKHETVS